MTPITPALSAGETSCPPGAGALPNTARAGFGAVVLAALALPGVWHEASAETAPQEGLIALKYQHYSDSQPGLQRITVNAPSVYVLAPLSSSWAIEGSAVADSVSGASPRWHTAVSGASRMHDDRKAGDVKLTHYRERSSVALGLSHSTEHDYVSTAVSLDARFSSADNNTTWNIGVGVSNDTINPVNQLVENQHKRTRELILGVTQAWSPQDLVQLNLGLSLGKGYFDDPYKTLDQRPDRRRQTALQLRWNHALADSAATLRSSWRWYHDSFGIQAHTLQAEWVQPLNAKWTLTPLLRYHTQSAASFYRDPVYDAALGEPYPVGYDPANPPATISLDQRLSAFGALTMGLRADYRLDALWTLDARLALYQQRSGWRLGGGGSPGLADFKATTVVLGASRKF
jgi:hypothetical protein